MKTGLYIHFPFCVKKCNYCDFLSFAIEGNDCAHTHMQDYIESLIGEMAYRSKYFKHWTLTSVFVGGGTPSLMTKEQIQLLMTSIFKYFHVDKNAEITWESNPGTLNKEKLEAMHKTGINRLSIGLQSANNDELACLGRIHTWEDFKKNYKDALEAGFTNINIDLMSALPNQSLETYKETLEKVIDLNPTHISAYSLIIEEGTPFGLQEEALNLPDEAMDRQMYAATETMLKSAGYNRYEISNYAKKGFECQHNIIYWHRDNYLGLGLGAASLVDNQRFSNITNLKEYIDIWHHPILNKNTFFATVDYEKLSKTAQMEEFMFLGLRLINGINIEAFNKAFGENIMDVYGHVIKKHIKDHTLVFDGDYLRLTSYGIDVSNQVLCDFILS